VKKISDPSADKFEIFPGRLPTAMVPATVPSDFHNASDVLDPVAVKNSSLPSVTVWVAKPIPVPESPAGKSTKTFVPAVVPLLVHSDELLLLESGEKNSTAPFTAASPL
jgi:hypothetical protein